jgi:formylglycine-generating enzyme required for sulfatase activity
MAAMAGGLVLLLIVVLVPMFSTSLGFTLIVKGATPGSDLYVDGTQVGIPANDGTIKAFGLDASRERTVVVRCPGGAENKKTINCRDGEVYTLEVDPSQCDQLPREIQYGGVSMMLIEAGEFTMGDDRHEQDEKPAHTVQVDTFYIDKFEVTNEDYAAFCRETGAHTPTDTAWNREYFENPKNAKSPVMGVTWAQANDYALWRRKRLPTEIEWEKAASWGPKGGKTVWPWGNEQQADRAVLNSAYPAPVGTHPQGASRYGVHDMAGNAAEWVADHYSAYPNNPDPNPSSYGTDYRVTRGGSLSVGLEKARTTYRLPRVPNYGPGYLQTNGEPVEKSFFGFRCAVSANDPGIREVLQKGSGSGK